MSLSSLLSGSSDAVMSITTSDGSDKLLVLRMEGHERLGRLPEYRLELVGNTTVFGTAEDIDIHDLLGTQATVKIAVHGATRHVSGHFTQMVRGDRHGRYQAFSAVLRPWLWFATRSRTSRVFQNKSVKDIVTDVLTPYSTDFEWRLLVASAYQPMEYCTQYDESDFDFVSRLLEDAGIYYFFEHDDGCHTMVLTDSMAKHRSKADSGAVKWARSLKHESTIVDWRCHEEVRAKKVSLRDHDYQASTTAIESEKEVPVTSATARLGDTELYLYPAGAVQNQKQAQSQPASSAMTALAGLRLEEEQSLQRTWSGSTNALDIAYGATFRLDRSGAPTESVHYLVVACSFHAEYADHEAIEDLRGIKRRRDGFVADIVAIDMTDGVFRPERVTPRPRMHGPHTALVVGASGNEIETDALGRIKVQFHWDRDGVKDQNSSCWVRVAQPFAGKGMGWWALPRVGHEVVVSFLGGDPDRPLVTGSVHNDQNTPPYPLPAQKHVSGWRTHSTAQGAEDAYNELRFSDEKDAEYVWLQAQKDFRRLVKDSVFDVIEKNETLKVKLTRKEVIGEDWLANVVRDVMLEIGRDWHHKVAGDVLLTGGASWQVLMAGDISMKTDADASFDVTGATALKSGGDIALQSDGAVGLKSGGDWVQEASGKVSAKAGGDLVLQGAAVKIKADGEIVIEGAQGIKLVCGSSVISLSSSGVDIAGTAVNINCGGGGGSAGSADAAPDAEPKEAAEAQVAEALQSDQAEDYDEQFADPLAAGASS